MSNDLVIPSEGMLNLIRAIIKFPGNVMIYMVRMYQVCISPMLGPKCKYEPTCSAYFIEAVKKYGAVRGGIKGIWRICRCNPFSKGGIDPP